MIRHLLLVISLAAACALPPAAGAAAGSSAAAKASATTTKRTSAARRPAASGKRARTKAKRASAKRTSAQAKSAPAPKAAKADSTAGMAGGPRRLEDIHIEGEIPAPQVLFVTARDQRRFTRFHHQRYLKTSVQVGETTQLPTRIALTHPSTQAGAP